MFVNGPKLFTFLNKLQKSKKLLPLEESYLGGAVTAYILDDQDLPGAEISKFRITCIEFFQELLDQIKMRFSFKI